MITESNCPDDNHLNHYCEARPPELSIRSKFPEFNDDQWKMLERELLALVPKKQPVDHADDEDEKCGFNKAVNEMTNSIVNALRAPK